MYYVLLYYPRFDSETEENIEAFRKKYDPFVGSLKPHIPVIFPVPCNKVVETKLTEHIETVLRNWKPFQIQLNGFKKSWDNWLLLVLKKGNENAIALHNELYTGILSPYMRKDIEYIPHIGMGLFVKKEAEYNVLDPRKVDFDVKLYSRALKEAKFLKINSFDTVDRLSLDKIKVRVGKSLQANAQSRDNLAKTVSSKEIKL
jgi:2'-5' RNA ligase